MTVRDKTLKKELPEFGYRPEPDATEQYIYALLGLFAAVLVF